MSLHIGIRRYSSSDTICNEQNYDGVRVCHIEHERANASAWNHKAHLVPSKRSTRIPVSAKRGEGEECLLAMHLATCGTLLPSSKIYLTPSCP